MLDFRTPDKTPRLVRPPGLRVAIDQVDLRIADCDTMYAGNVDHYFGVGLSALNCVQRLLGLANLPAPASILDFGGGAGRVARWLKAAYPEATITVAERDAEQLGACAELFGVETWLSDGDIGTLVAPGGYDLIWAGSVLTHLSEADSIQLLNHYVDWANPGGLVVVTTHGRRALRNVELGRLSYIEEEWWEEIERGYHQSGYGYADYDHQQGYGISLVSIEWISRHICQLPAARLVGLCEAGWDDHQDVVAVQAQGI
jgi:SAM-dependent methyltransferase